MTSSIAECGGKAKQPNMGDAREEHPLSFLTSPPRPARHALPANKQLLTKENRFYSQTRTTYMYVIRNYIHFCVCYIRMSLEEI